MNRLRSAAGRPMRRSAALLAFVLLTAACGLPSESARPAGTSVFRSGELVLDYPSNWRLYTDNVFGSFSSLLGFLGTVEVPDPCTRSANSVTCGSDPYELAPGTLVVSLWSEGGLHENDLEAMPLTIAGMPASFAVEPGGQTMADTRLVWHIATGPNGAYEIAADLRGPGLEEMTSAVKEMIASLRFEPARLTIPSEPVARETAAQAAVVSTLDALVRDSTGYRCFPKTVGASAPTLLTEVPFGPPLPHSITGTCRVRIEATRYQQWKLTLTIDLAEPVDGATRDILTQWMLPDGTLTLSTGRWE